jgi:hypothetical protein
MLEDAEMQHRAVETLALEDSNVADPGCYSCYPFLSNPESKNINKRKGEQN